MKKVYVFSCIFHEAQASITNTLEVFSSLEAAQQALKNKYMELREQDDNLGYTWDNPKCINPNYEEMLYRNGRCWYILSVTEKELL